MNDCDEVVDNLDGQVCGSQIGECQEGTRSCVDGTFSACEGGIEAVDEVCGNRLDEDCDGTADEDCPCTLEESQSCGTSVGECVEGEQACESGTWGRCMGATVPETEVCDDKDNDCDGSLDEDVTRTCGSSTGECMAGVETCEAGEWQGVCAGQVLPMTEVCDAEGKDEDCDGDHNEDCACTNGATQSCGTTDVGPCALGIQTCSNDEWNPSCVGRIDPQTEVCNGVDDDCDGATDEPGADVCPGEHCVAGQCRACTSATQVQDCGASTACVRRECVSHQCETTALSTCSGPAGQPGTCGAEGSCRYCGDGAWTQSTEDCDESATGWVDSCEDCEITTFSWCNAYEGQSYCPNNELCAFVVCAQTCTVTQDCPQMPTGAITCRELFAGDSNKYCLAECRVNHPEDCPLPNMVCDNAGWCGYSAQSTSDPNG